MSRALIQPLDPLFFRNGKPFTMGEDDFAESLFPPLPSTLYGAIRSAYISQKGTLKKFMNEKMKDTIGTREQAGSFKLKGLAIWRDGQCYFPAPLDLFRLGEENKAGIAKLHNNLPFYSDDLFPALLFPTQKDAKPVEGRFVSLTTLKEYLLCQEKTFSLEEQSSFRIPEPKTGIGKDSFTGTTEEGLLYSISMQRWIKGVKLALFYEGLDLERGWLLKLGGEGKSAVIDAVNGKSSALEIDEEELVAKIEETKRFKLYLATPAIFEKGWHPGFTEENGGWIWKRDGWKLKLLTAAIWKPLAIGGWDMAERKPKPMRKAIPAGSVYYFEVLEGEADTIIASLHEKNISELYPEQGFGLSFLGGVI